GGTPITLCDAGLPAGLSWRADDIVFSPFGGNGVMRVSANGGRPESLIPLKTDEHAINPQILPGGQAVLFTLTADDVIINGTWGRAKIVVQSLPSGPRKTLIDVGFGAHYLPTNHLVYVADDKVFAVPFDPQQLRVAGAATPVIAGIGVGLSGAA